jgi:23S rRNA (cytidine1920-2'-O)/16S rRNA (cytidine1409-2'-O)-methyltransferase
MTAGRIDAVLVHRGLARSRGHAADLVRAGRVHASGVLVRKPSEVLSAEEPVVVAADPDDANYASRAAYKLAGALDALDDRSEAQGGQRRTWAQRLAGAWCLDLGASTGGFTDVLLRRGAAHVVALDVGHGQLLPRLREDPRVTVIEGRNVRDLTAADVARAPDVIVADLSFISLTLVMPVIASVLDGAGSALLLVKPQFEVGRERLGAGGVVRDPAQHVESVLAVIGAGQAAGLGAMAVVPSPLPGPSGNAEFFVEFAPGVPSVPGAPGVPAAVGERGAPMTWTAP